MNNVQKNFKKQMSKSLKELKKKDYKAYEAYHKRNHLDEVDVRLSEEKQEKVKSIIIMPFKKILRTIFGFILFLFVLGFAGNIINKTSTADQGNLNHSNTSQSSTAQSETIRSNLKGQTFSNPYLVLTSQGSGNDGIKQFINGTIKNNSNQNYSYVTVEINLYDADDNQISSTSASINNFQPGTTWAFKAYYYINDVKKYRIIDIKGL